MSNVKMDLKIIWYAYQRNSGLNHVWM